MASFKDPRPNPALEAARLKPRFRSRRIEARYRLREIVWWLSVCAAAGVAGFVGVYSCGTRFRSRIAHCVTGQPATHCSSAAVWCGALA
jgi:hypothetical protein